ncbi:MAG: hypothetical protein RL518_1376 [Pseudomonadota bacterium]
MEDSKPEGKKIILKRRTKHDGDSDLTTEIIEAPASSETTAQPVDETKYFYEGEIFDQFHRPLKVKGGVERLQEIASRPLSISEPHPRESARQRDAQSKERQSIAEALAHQIYKLAQKDRETQLDVYLSAFNVALSERTCDESLDILTRANEFFTEHYYAVIRERGERPEIYNQIIKRVGHSHADRLQRIVFGLDVEATAKKLWDIYQGGHSDKANRILDILLDCTEMQVIALREEFLKLPYKDLARQLFAVLNQSQQSAPAAGRRTIGKSELTEHKKTTAFRARDQLRALRYLLRGRSEEELTLVKRFYMDLGEPQLPANELTLEFQARRLFPPAEFERLAALMRGWSPHGEAEEIHKVMTMATVRGVIDDPYGDPREIVEREYTQGIGPFLRRFKRSRLLRDHTSVIGLSCIAYHQLRERVAALSYSRFLATNQALRDYYGYELEPSLFLSLRLFDARERAVLFHERLEVSFDIFEALQPIEFLDPRQCLAVEKAHQSLFGMAMREALEQRLSAVGATTPPADLAAVCARYLDGHGRWPLNIDLLAQYRADDSGCGVWDYDHVPSQEVETLAVRLGEIVDVDRAPTEMDRVIRETLSGLSTEALHELERVFFDMTEPCTPLRETLAEVMTPDGYSLLMVSFGGFESGALVQRLHEDPLYARYLRELPSDDIIFLRESFKRTFYVDLVDHVIRGSETADDKDVGLEAISALLKPEVLAVRRLLGEMKRETQPELETLRLVCSGPALKVMGFERAYDNAFFSFRVHLKTAAARLSLTVNSFVELILLLEGIDPDILLRVQECFDTLDIQTLQEILRAHKHTQKLIEECYDLVYPDRTFRHALKELQVDPDLINETLLHLEGYCAQSVALELRQLVESLEGSELASKVLDVLVPQSHDRVNERIPQDINWMDEMIYQIGLSYRRQFGESLVISCRKKGVANHALEDISGRLYGPEVSSTARELFNLIKCAKEGVEPPQGADARICSYLESRGPKYRERLMAAYQSHWAHQAGFGGLLDDLTKHFNDSASKRKLLAMFLSTSSDRKAPPPPIPDLH